MMDFIEHFERQLVEAARAEYPRPRRVRRAWRPPLVAIAAMVLIAASALAATRPWRPLFGEKGEPQPSVTSQPPPQAQLAILGVLRRPQTTRDRSALTRAQLRFVGLGESGVRTPYIRLLGVGSTGRGVVLVPVHRFDPLGNGSHGPASRFVVDDALCVIQPDPKILGAGKVCYSTAQVRRGQTLASVGRENFGLVPDGVARVTAGYSHGLRASGVVHDNYFQFRAPAQPRNPRRHEGEPYTLTFADSAGRTVLKLCRLKHPKILPAQAQLRAGNCP